MAGNDVEIRVTAKDDSKKALQDAEKNIKGVGDAADDAGKQVKGFGDDSERAGGKVRGLGDDAKRTQDEVGGFGSRIGKGGADLQKYGADLDGVGDGFNDVEDRAMGAANILGGMTDLMNPENPQAFAQGLSDSAAGIRYAVVPTIQDLARGVSGVVGNMRNAGGPIKALKVGLDSLPSGAKTAALALGAVGVAAAGLAIINHARIERVGNALDSMVKGMDTSTVEGSSAALRTYRQELAALMDEEGKGRIASFMGTNLFATNGDADRQERIDQLRDRIKDLTEVSGEAEAQERQTAAAYSGSSEALRGLNIETVDAINGLQEYADAQRAQIDPVFGMVDALDRNRSSLAAADEAQRAYNEAVDQYGADSPEALAAQQALTSAQNDAVRSAQDVTGAMAELNAAVLANPALVHQSKAQIDLWAQQGLITTEQAAAMKVQMDNAAAAAQNLGAQDPHVSATMTDHTWDTIETIKSHISQLPREVVVNIRAEADANRFQASRLLRASGGITGAASGGNRGARTLVGERGPEIVDLPYGSNVVPAASTRAALSAAGSGGGPVQVVLALDTARGGLERALMEALRVWVRNTTGGDVQAALGWG